MTDRLTAVVCDDHPLFRKGVVACLASDPNLDVISSAADGQACIGQLELHRPSILVIDLSLPVLNGFEVLEWARKHQPGLRVYILSMHTELAYVQRALQLGAAGFLAKEDAETELLAAIRSTPGDFYTSSSTGRLRQPSTTLADVGFQKALSRVSDAEMKVLVLLTENLTSRQIADRLCLSSRTVQAHRVNLSAKLEARGPNKLLEVALGHRDEILAARR
jgi:DNA-binding NarL/FixJ family response regulator